MPEREFNVDMKWDPQADIHIKGYEWEDMSNVLQMFQNAMIAYNSVIARNVAIGVIKVRYLYADDGTEVPEIEVQKRQAAQMKDYEEKLKANRNTQPAG